LLDKTKGTYGKGKRKERNGQGNESSQRADLLLPDTKLNKSRSDDANTNDLNQKRACTEKEQKKENADVRSREKRNPQSTGTG